MAGGGGLASHLQDQVAQVAFVVSQCLRQGCHPGQGVPLLCSL